MPISDLPILSMLRTRMQWHQDRQRLLSENVANADTPNFKPRDLAPLDLARASARSGTVRLALTDAAHQGGANRSGFGASAQKTGESRPSGNAVNLEDEMMKVASNQMDYQAATALYSRSLGLIKLALGSKQ
ncbi:MAG: flagellar basal-body rod protein FlgB [Variibacter sp.]|jgi:flagellar basal-body rod protein FlgB|nr:flagellar basal-body rod protein FlgB [Variibacter sp.]